MTTPTNANFEDPKWQTLFSAFSQIPYLILHYLLLLKLQLLLLLLLPELLLDPQRSPDYVPLAPVSGVGLVLGP